MTMTKKEQAALTESPAARAQVRALYTNITDNELRDTKNLSKVISERTGEDQKDVDKALKAIVAEHAVVDGDA